jgi:hypothetical protein
MPTQLRPVSIISSLIILEHYFAWLFEECLDAGQHIVNHYLRSRLDALSATGLKVNGANLVTQNNTLRLGA